MHFCNITKKSKTNLEEVDALDDVEIDDDVDTELVVEKLKTEKKKTFREN